MNGEGNKTEQQKLNVKQSDGRPDEKIISGKILDTKGDSIDLVSSVSPEPSIPPAQTCVCSMCDRCLNWFACV
jgi:hypothetical protein